MAEKIFYFLDFGAGFIEDRQKTHRRGLEDRRRGIEDDRRLL
jgi:hypothetical protein